MNCFKALVLAGLAAGLASAQAAVWVSEVTLSGAQESPPNASLGTGTATVTFDDESKVITVNGSFSGLTTAASNAHVHGPSAFGGAAAGVVFGLSFTAATSGTFSGSTTYNSTRETELLNELHYINIHSSTYPGGELRGQIMDFVMQVPEPEEYATMAGVGLLGFAVWRKRRLGLAAA